MVTCRAFVTGLTARVFMAALASLTKALARVTGVTGMKFSAADVVTPVHVSRSTYETLPPVNTRLVGVPATTNKNCLYVASS